MMIFLPSFTSPASGSTADNQLHIKALTTEIEQLQKKLDKLTKERETFGTRNEHLGLMSGKIWMPFSR